MMHNFKVGDKVKVKTKFHWDHNKYYNSKSFEVLKVTEHLVYLKDDTHMNLFHHSHIVLEEEPMNTNPCIQTEEVKVIKTKIVSGYPSVKVLQDGKREIDLVPFSLGPSTLKDHVFVNTRYSHGAGSMSASELRKLARQLDEIANVLDSTDGTFD